MAYRQQTDGRHPFCFMKTNYLPRAFVAAMPVLSLLALTACVAPTPPRPLVAYPVTYEIPVGNTQVRANTGAQNLQISPHQDVSVIPGRTLYYQVVSPIDVVVSVYELSSTNPPTAATRLTHSQGTNFTASLTPSTSALRFSFAAAQANTSGTARFTLSDTPLAPSVAPQPTVIVP